MKNLKKVLALVLAVVMIMGTVAVASAKDFKDVKATDNYAKAIDVLSNLGIIDGFTDGEYKPEGYFTRAQAAKMVAIVHNAATNGEIKGQDGISDLYGNAQNAFTDCTGNWAVAYINYCRATGLLDGITRTTYAPNSKLTGVQWLKLMLTTLNFDTNKEGYLGAGWDVNVLNRANEIKLLDGLAKGWKGNVPVTRGEAAQILYNTLKAYLVEYGQLIKNGKVTLDKAFVANESVEATGFTLAAKMGVGVVRSTDAFRRPGYTWSYGAWKAFYMDAPAAEYKTAVSTCTILKDLGIAETNPTVLTLNGHRADAKALTTETTIGKNFTDNGTALNYFAVDGFKYAYDYNSTYVTLKHDNRKNCQKLGHLLATINNLADEKFGGQGDLTQVFKTEDGVVITTVHTFLAQVDGYNTPGKYDHTKKNTSSAKVWVTLGHESPVYGDETGYRPTQMTLPTAEYTEGTMLLVTMSLKKTEAANKVHAYANADIQDVIVPETKTGKLTGASSAAYPETVSIDGTKYPTNCRFIHGKDNAMNIANNGKTYTFYFDTYGNVIGRTAVAAEAAQYVVVTKIWAEHVDGDFTIKANLVDMTGKEIEKATVARASSFVDAKDAYGEKHAEESNQNWNYPNDKLMFMVAAHNDANLLNALYSYTVNDKGVYTLTWVGEDTSSRAALTKGDHAFGRLSGKFVHTAKLAYMLGTNVTEHPSDLDYVINFSESTKFLCKNIDGTYSTYTGYTELPALTAAYVDYVYEAGSDGEEKDYVSVVYLGSVCYASDSITGYVTKWDPYNWAEGYDLITVYVDGEPVVVNVEHAPTEPLINNRMYVFTTKVDKNGVTYSDAHVLSPAVNAPVTELYRNASNDVTAIKVNDRETAIGLTGVAIYNVLKDGTLVKADASCIAVGDTIMAYGATEPYTAIYVIDKDFVG